MTRPGRPRRRGVLSGRSLSRRLLLATIAFALVLQFAVYAPIVANEHQALLRSRIQAAQTAVLAFETLLPFMLYSKRWRRLASRRVGASLNATSMCCVIASRCCGRPRSGAP